MCVIVCVCVFMFVDKCTCMCVCVHIHVLVYIVICVCTCVHVWVNFTVIMHLKLLAKSFKGKLDVTLGTKCFIVTLTIAIR